MVLIYINWKLSTLIQSLRWSSSSFFHFLWFLLVPTSLAFNFLVVERADESLITERVYPECRLYSAWDTELKFCHPIRASQQWTVILVCQGKDNLNLSNQTLVLLKKRRLHLKDYHKFDTTLLIISIWGFSVWVRQWPTMPVNVSSCMQGNQILVAVLLGWMHMD